jgi:Protein of unknown function (DUF2568)
MLTTLRRFNLALRGLMETGIVIGLGYWGWQFGESLGVKVLLAAGAPLLVFGFWGLVDFRWTGAMAERLRLGQELIISGLAAVALYAAGQHGLGWALGLISLIHHVLVYLLGGVLLKR